MTGIRNLGRRTAVTLVVALLMTTAGCSSLSGQSTSTATETTAATETTEPSTSTATTANGTATSGDAGTTGTVAVVVDGQRIDLAERLGTSGGSFHIDEDRRDVWHADGNPTLAAALSEADVDASASSLTFEGETYDASRSGTEVVYRVDGEPVDPSRYELQEGDEVWVLVLTEGSDPPTPGEHIPSDRLHVHGSMEFVVNGDSLDFSREKWQAASHNDHFHFEGSHADPWHAHSWSVTLEYALSTLQDIEVTDHGIRYNGTTYSDGEAGTTVRITANGEPVDPSEYYLKDGDDIRIVIESAS